MASFLRKSTAYLVLGALTTHPIALSSQQGIPRSRGGDGQWVGGAIQAIDTVAPLMNPAQHQGMGPLMGQPGIIPTQSHGAGHLMSPLSSPQIPGQISPQGQDILARSFPQDALVGPFKGCLLPQDLKDLPHLRCEKDLPPSLPPSQPGVPNPFAIYSNLLDNAMKNSTFFSGMDNGDDASKGTQGLRCLKDRMDLEETKFQAILNQLGAQRDEVKRKNEEFKAQAERLREKMEDLNAVLSGEAEFGGSNASRPAGRLAQLINSDTCRDILTTASIENAQGRGGLRGLRSQITESNTKARQYQDNENQLMDDINGRLQKIVADMNNHGVDAWLNSANTPVLNEERIGNFNGLKEEKVRDINMERDRIRGELENLGFTGKIPYAGKDFGADFGEFHSNFERNKGEGGFVNACVTNTDNIMGTQRGLRQIIEELEQTDASNRRLSGTAISFRDDIDAIVFNNDDDRFIDEKMQEIKEKVIETGVNNVTVGYRVDGRDVRSNIHQIIERAIEDCKEKYHNRRDNSGLTPRQRHEKISGLLKEYQSSTTQFQEGIQDSLFKKIIECDGKSLDAGKCNETVYSTDSDSFCFNKALKCASDTRKCHDLVEKQIQKKEVELNWVADEYNKGVTNLIDAQNAILNTLKTRIYAYGQLIGNTTGTPFALPEEAFVLPPELSRSSLGVLLLGGDNVEAVFNQITAKIDILQDALQQQNKEMMAKLQEKFNEHQRIIKENKSRWEAVANSCQQKIDQFQQAQGQAMGQQMQQQQEMMGKTGTFCQKFHNWKGRHPLAGCDDVDSLYEDSLEIASILTPEANEYINDYKYACAAMNNESEKGTEGEIDESGYIVDDCLRNPSAAAVGLAERARDSILSSFGDIEDQDKVNDYLRGGGNGESPFIKRMRRENPRDHRTLTRLRDVLNDKPHEDQNTSSTIKKIFPMSSDDMSKINTELSQLKSEHCSPPSVPGPVPTTFLERIIPRALANPTQGVFCNWINNLSGPNFITDSNIDEHRDNLEDIVLPLAKPHIHDILNEDKRLKEIAQRELDKVFEEREKNFCTLIALDAITSATENCQGENNPRDCFEEELEEMQTEGTRTSRFLASIVEDSPDRKFDDNIGELHGADFSCSFIEDSQRNEHPEIVGEEDTGPRTTLDDIRAGEGR